MSEPFVPNSDVEGLSPRRLFVGTFPDGSQLMVEEWYHEDGTIHAVTAATRPTADRSVVWGPPITLEEE